jgi:hypothetical protein
MKPRTTIRTLLAAALVATVTLVPATAWAGSCTFQISPSPGWRGADITISGFQMSPNTAYYVNFGGNQIKTGTTNGNGAFSFHYTIPGNYPVGTTNWFVGQNPGCEMTESRDYTVMAAEPTTTTTSTTTTTTTTIAPTTTAAPTTTVAATTTTPPGTPRRRPRATPRRPSPTRPPPRWQRMKTVAAFLRSFSMA